MVVVSAPPSLAAAAFAPASGVRSPSETAEATEAYPHTASPEAISASAASPEALPAFASSPKALPASASTAEADSTTASSSEADSAPSFSLSSALLTVKQNCQSRRSASPPSCGSEVFVRIWKINTTHEFLAQGPVKWI